MTINFEEISPYKNAELEIYSIVTDDVAAVTLTVTLDDDLYGHPAEFTAGGSSKRHPSDPSDPALGEALALSRALEEVSRQLASYSSTKIDEIQFEKQAWREAAERLKKARNSASTTIINIPAGAGLDR